MEQWVVVIKVDDEPPLAAIITGVVGTFPNSTTAEEWAKKFDAVVQADPAPRKTRPFYTIMPLSDPVALLESK